MSSPAKVRTFWTLPESLKERTELFAKAHGKSASDVAAEALEAFLGVEESGDPLELQERKVEGELHHVDGQLEKLESSDRDRSRKLAKVLLKVYPKFDEDWRARRFRALEDFRKKKAAWVSAAELSPLPVKKEMEIIDACRIATDLLRLRRRRNELEGELRGLYSSTPAPAAPIPLP